LELVVRVPTPDMKQFKSFRESIPVKDLTIDDIENAIKMIAKKAKVKMIQHIEHEEKVNEMLLDLKVNEMLLDLWFKTLSVFKFTGKEESNIYISKIDFIDAITKMRIPSEESALIENNAFESFLERILRLNPRIKYNDANHTIENTPANVQKLIDIVFDPLLTPEKRMGQIISDIMSPAKVDVIVMGQYVDNQQTLRMRFFMIIKASQKIVSKALDFKKDEYFCPDPVDKNRKALCQNAHGSIAQAVKELLESL